MERVGRRTTIDIERGIFLVRYAASEDSVLPPKIKVSTDRTTDSSITFMLHPDCKHPILYQPGTCLVARAIAAGKLCVEVIPVEASSSLAATVKVEPLMQGTSGGKSTRSKR